MLPALTVLWSVEEWAVTASWHCPELYLTLPLPNPDRLSLEVAWALSLSLWWAKDRIYKRVTEFKSTLWDRICSCFYAVCLCYVWHLPNSPEKTLLLTCNGIPSCLKWKRSDWAIWFRKIDHFNGVKNISFDILTFTLFYCWGVLVPASSSTPTQLLMHFGNST